MKRQVVATIAGGLVLFVLQALTGLALGPIDIEMPPNIVPWTLLSNVLIAGMLAWLARRSAWAGWPLAAALFAIGYGMGQANSLIEAHVFNIFPRPGLLAQIAVYSIVPALLFAPILVWLTGRWSTPARPAAAWPARSAASWIARFAACCVAYLLLYFAAGTIIFPYVQEFYERLTLPAASTIILLQLLVRGPIFAASGLLIIRMIPAARLEHALMVGIAMLVLAGVAPLVIPNPFFPETVRWVHMMEVVPSNFLFGFVTGWLLGGTREPHGSRVASAAA